MESLAIDEFKDYQGPLEVKTMLVHLLGHSMDAVKSPITDSTGQTRYVDEYLGPADSKLRKGASTQFGQMRADGHTEVQPWNAGNMRHRPDRDRTHDGDKRLTGLNLNSRLIQS